MLLRRHYPIDKSKEEVKSNIDTPKKVAKPRNTARKKQVETNVESDK